MILKLVEAHNVFERSPNLGSNFDSYSGSWSFVEIKHFSWFWVSGNTRGPVSKEFGYFDFRSRPSLNY